MSVKLTCSVRLVFQRRIDRRTVSRRRAEIENNYHWPTRLRHKSLVIAHRTYTESFYWSAVYLVLSCPYSTPLNLTFISPHLLLGIFSGVVRPLMWWLNPENICPGPAFTLLQGITASPLVSEDSWVVCRRQSLRDTVEKIKSSWVSFICCVEAVLKGEKPNLQTSCWECWLKICLGRGTITSSGEAWRAAIQGVAKSRTWLNDLTDGTDWTDWTDACLWLL